MSKNTTTITITKEAKEALDRVKDGRSYSNTIIRLVLKEVAKQAEQKEEVANESNPFTDLFA